MTASTLYLLAAVLGAVSFFCFTKVAELNEIHGSFGRVASRIDDILAREAANASKE